MSLRSIVAPSTSAGCVVVVVDVLVEVDDEVVVDVLVEVLEVEEVVIATGLTRCVVVVVSQ